MKEIKFRAWDKTLKLMKGFDTFCIYQGKPIDICEDIYVPEQGGGTYERGFRSIYGKVKFNDDVILMQYTGLKDKKGKEIYEGDILALYEPEGWIFKSKEAKKRYEEFEKKVGIENMKGEKYTKINEETQRYSDKKTYQGKKVVVSSEEIEVIGNIYENPELLK